MSELSDRLVEQVIERGWNRGELYALDDVVAPGYVRHLSDGRTLRSREEFKEHMAGRRSAMLDLHTTVHHAFADGENGAARFTLTATLVDGSPLRFDGAVVIRIEDGMLAEEWEFFDTAAIAKAVERAGVALDAE